MVRIAKVERVRRRNGQARYVVTEDSGAPLWGPDADLAVVGHAHRRVEGREKVSGRATYAYDVRLPGLLFARVLRSPYPHARVRRVDTARAAALPGVYAVLSSADAPPIRWYEQSYLFDRTVRYVGDEVAAVAAESEDVAEDALRLIDVEYEPLPFVVDLVAATRPDAPKVWPSGNCLAPRTYQRGDVDAGLAAADHIVDETYATQAALHNCLEPHGCTATWDGEQLTLWDSTQSVFGVRDGVAEALGLPAHHVRIIKQYMGGGFGSKQVAWKHTVIAALLSRQARRPVQLMLDREAENLAAGNRNPTRQRVRLGARRDGTLTAIHAHIEQGVGAYLLGGEGSEVSGPYQGLYRCPNVRTEQVAVYTHTGPAAAFRAPGWVEGAFALESAMDELAHALGVDPLALRRRNYTAEDQQRGVPYTLDGLRHCYDRAAAAFGWERYQKPPPPGSKRRGVGMAAHDWGGGGWPPAYAWVKLNADGTADVITGTQDIGTGTRTGLSQVAAEALGLPLERVALRLGDTQAGPYAPVSAGSATQATLGPAIQQAAGEARQQLLAAAAPMLDAAPAQLSARNGEVYVVDAPGRRLAVAEVMARIAPHMIQGTGARGPNRRDRSVGTFGAHFVEVEVDEATGEVTVLRLVACHDCGRIVNPTLVQSQVIGGITQGLGYALSEERVVDQASGVVLNANLEEYKVPTVADVPALEYVPLGLPDLEANSTGAKGIGEPPLVPTAPAIANAVYDAVGVRLRELPLTRARLLAALAARGEARR